MVCIIYFTELIKNFLKLIKTQNIFTFMDEKLSFFNQEHIMDFVFFLTNFLKKIIKLMK